MSAFSPIRVCEVELSGRLPVIEEGQVAGMVSLGDLALRDDPASALAVVAGARACA